MKKTALTIVFVLAAVIGASGQIINFGVQSDGSFKTAEGKNFVVIDCPGFTQQQLFFAFLATIQHKCVTSGVQYNTIDNKCINVYSYESYFENYSFWNGGFMGYLYYKFMFQFKDGKVRIEDPIVDHLGNGSKNTVYQKFAEMIHNPQRPLFNDDGTPVAKRKDVIEKLNRDLNTFLNDILGSALSVANWQ